MRDTVPLRLTTPVSSSTIFFDQDPDCINDALRCPVVTLLHPRTDDVESLEQVKDAGDIVVTHGKACFSLTAQFGL